MTQELLKDNEDCTLQFEVQMLQNTSEKFNLVTTLDSELIDLEDSEIIRATHYTVARCRDSR